MTHKEALNLVKGCGFNIEAPLHNEVEKIVVRAIERQIPKKLTHEASLYKCCTCPNCKNVLDRFEKWGESTVRITVAYCVFCGQALDWEDE